MAVMKPIDVAVLDATVEALYATDSSKEERGDAERILRDLKADPDIWLQVLHILQNTTSTQTKIFALLVLEGVIKYRWNVLPVEQRHGMKNYISQLILKLSTDEASIRSERLYINKLNVVLVQIVKQEWPAKWTNFIPDLIKAAQTSETICENCMAILKLLSEEFFDIPRGEMTLQKIHKLKECLTRESQVIHELYVNVLSAPRRPELICSTLSALQACLSWISFPQIFDSALLETLLQLFPVEAYRNLVLQCLSQVAALNPTDLHNLQYVNLYREFIKKLQGILPLNTDFAETYSTGTSEYQAFIQNLALFFTSFFKLHIRIIESAPENISLLRTGLEYLTRISYVEDNKVFKVCLDYWNSLVLELCGSHHHGGHSALTPSLFGLKMDFFRHSFKGVTKRRKLYSALLSKLRGLMLSRMAKPEEALIVVDENENIVETDNYVLLQYKLMRKTLINLLHLDHDDTKQQMLGKLSEQISGLSSKLSSNDEPPWDNLNTLCCAIGSISGSMGAAQENRFMETVINDLCSLRRKAKKDEDKAVIATNVMYVASQYSRFLRTHWMILMTLVLSLFECMHNPHPGLKDMACNTFFKIVQQCKHELVIVHRGDRESFLSEILLDLATIIEDLEPHQLHTFFKSVGCMIQAESNPQKRAEYLEKLMDIPNKEWTAFIGEARQRADYLKDPDVMLNVLIILQINTSVSSSLGTYFLSQFSWIFLDMLDVYRMYSELVSNNIADGGPLALRKELRSVKREILKLIETFLDADYEPETVIQFVQPMMDRVLGDYASNVPDAREPEVLSLFAMLINKYKVIMQNLAPQIFQGVFQGQETLEVITMNFENDREHCVKFLALLCDLATFGGDHVLIQLSIEQLKLVMDLVIWSIRHIERNIAKTGLNLLLEMLKKIQKSGVCNQFYKTYFMQIEQEIFAVLADTLHKSEFNLHVLVLHHLFSMVESRYQTEPLWNTPHLSQNNAVFVCESTIELLSSVYPNMPTSEVESDDLTEPLCDTTIVPHPYQNNAAYVRESTMKLLSSSFPNMTTSEVTQFVNGLYESRGDLGRFKNSIRDFLIQSKQFSANQDNKYLYAEEAGAHMERERDKGCFRFLDLSLPRRLRTLILRKSLLS